MSPSAPRRTAALVWTLAATSLALTLAGPAPTAAQETSGGLSTTIPTLRGAVDDPSPLSPDAGIRPGAGDADTPPPAGGDAVALTAPASKFAPPKGTAKTRDRVKVERKGPPRLPALQPYPTALRQRGGGAPLDAASVPASAAPVPPPAPSTAALPVPPLRLRTKILDDGYTPVGYEVGSLRLTPYVAQSFGYDSNPDQVQTGVRASSFSRTEGGLGLVSQWAAHELRADLRGGYNDYFSNPGANRPDAIGTIDLRLDANRDLTIDNEARFSIDTQRPGSPELNADAVTRPLIVSFGATTGVTQTFGRVSIGLHGSFDRIAYDNATLADGTLEDLASFNYNDYGLRLRAAYELTPVFKPFVDVLADDRIHDDRIDITGFRRDSVGVVAQAGSSFELTRLISGEISAGYGRRSYEDPRLRDLNGPVVNGALAYAITPLTVIGFKAATTFDETTVAGSSGAQSRALTLEVSHALLRDLTLTGAVSYLNTDYVGVPITENTWSETLKAEYHLSRSLVATAAYNHQALDSTAAGASFSQDVFLVGLRVQR